MSASNAFETMLLQYLLEQVAIPGLTTEVFIALHTANPGEAGNQTTNEATYTGYARQPVTRDGTEWTTTGDTTVNDNEIPFPEATAGSETITHFSVGMLLTGAGTVMFYGALDTPVPVSAGVTPRFQAGALSISVD